MKGNGIGRSRAFVWRDGSERFWLVTELVSTEMQSSFCANIQDTIFMH